MEQLRKLQSKYSDADQLIDASHHVLMPGLINTHNHLFQILLKSMGDDLNFVPTHHNTLQSLAHENIFVIGDATNVPASKAGSVAHFQAETLTDNILLYMDGYPLKKEFDGHANCFIETGDNKALLIDFNYVQEPVHGTFPFSKIGPLKLLKESVFNHWGKLAFRWIYWNMLLKGIAIPFVSRNMSFKGKIVEIGFAGEMIKWQGKWYRSGCFGPRCYFRYS